MKKILLLLSVLAAVTLAYAAPPSSGPATLRSENAEVNIETGTTGNINFATNGVRQWKIDGTTGALSSPAGASALFTPTLANNTYLLSTNAASSGTDSLIKADASDNTVINALTGKSTQFLVNNAAPAQQLISISANGVFTTAAQTTSDITAIQIKNASAAAAGTDVSALSIGDSGGSNYFRVGINNAFQPTANISVGNKLGLIVNTGGGAPMPAGSANLNFIWDTTGFNFNTAGLKITQKSGGAAATAGTFTCNGVTAVVVSTTAASTGMAIAFAPNTISGTAGTGSPFVSAISAATSFSVKCSIAGETSTYNWAMIGVS